MSKPSSKTKTFTLEGLVGKTLDDRYIVEDMIGTGAMGAVFRAGQTRLNRKVALKVPKPQFCLKEDFISRFQREALSMAKIVHPNIVQIYDVFISRNLKTPSFIVMELIDGITLDEFLDENEKELTIGDVMDILVSVAEGLDAAHQKGIIHRDIKPANITVTKPKLIPKIMDFGIAKTEMESAFETKEDKTLGTPAFMSPEQVTSQRLTPASDIYSFALTIYHILCQRSPYSATTVSGFTFAHVNESPVSPRKTNPNLPKKLDLVLLPALSKEPDYRPESASDLARQVADTLSSIKEKTYIEIVGNLPGRLKGHLIVHNRGESSENAEPADFETPNPADDMDTAKGQIPDEKEIGDYPDAGSIMSQIHWLKEDVGSGGFSQSPVGFPTLGKNFGNKDHKVPDFSRIPDSLDEIPKDFDDFDDIDDFDHGMDSIDETDSQEIARNKYQPVTEQERLPDHLVFEDVKFGPVSIPVSRSFRKELVGIDIRIVGSSLLSVLIGCLLLLIFIFSGESSEADTPDKQIASATPTPAPSPTPREVVAAVPVAPTPSPTPVITPTPLPTPQPTAVATAIATPEPTPTPEVVVTATPDNRPVATPSPTPRPRIVTPAPTPSPTPFVSRTVNYNPALYDRNQYPPTNQPGIRANVFRDLDRYLESEIEEPTALGTYLKLTNSLVNVDTPTSRDLVEKLKSLSAGNDEVGILFRIREPQSTIWDDRAELILDFQVNGRPSNRTDQNFRTTFMRSSTPITARFTKNRSTWTLVDFEGDIPPINR